MLGTKQYNDAIALLERDDFHIIEPLPGKFSGFKLLNLLAGLIARHKSEVEFKLFLEKMSLYIADNARFGKELLQNWRSESFVLKWARRDSKETNIVKTWSGNVV